MARTGKNRIAGLGRFMQALLGSVSMPYFLRIFRASATVEGSGTVGPEPMTSGSSPTTSEIISVSSVAGKAACASWPPLIRLRCLRTAFISWMVAPQASRPRVRICLSASVSGGAGAGSIADAPPEISAISRSRGPAASRDFEHPARTFARRAHRGWDDRTADASIRLQPRLDSVGNVDESAGEATAQHTFHRRSHGRASPCPRRSPASGRNRRASNASARQSEPVRSERT